MNSIRREDSGSPASYIKRTVCRENIYEIRRYFRLSDSQTDRRLLRGISPSSYKEILNKAQRPYNCLLLQTRYEYFICIPYRSNISHKYAFHFKKSKRSRENRSGLDYSKIVIIANKEFISSDEAVIDQDEYTETVRHIGRIRQDAERFVQDYIAHISGIYMLSEREFDRRYHYAPLKYFHKEMGIDSENAGGGSGGNSNMADAPAETP